MCSSGEGGIRTHGEVSPTQHFQCDLSCSLLEVTAKVGGFPWNSEWEARLTLGENWIKRCGLPTSHSLACLRFMYQAL